MRSPTLLALCFCGVGYESLSADRDEEHCLCIFAVRGTNAARAENESGHAPHLYQHQAFSANATRAENKFVRPLISVSTWPIASFAAKEKHERSQASHLPSLSAQSQSPHLPRKRRMNQPGHSSRISHLYQHLDNGCVCRKRKARSEPASHPIIKNFTKCV